jgi:LPXTG-motif cell wall-anchored protein
VIRVLLLIAWALAYPRAAEAQVYGQVFQVQPDTHRATVGDTVTLRFRVRLDERDLLFDTVPQPLGALPPGVRVLSVDKLTRAPDRVFHGQARLAFFRPGRQPVPIFMLPFMRAVKGVQRGTLASDSAFVEIGTLVPAGNPALKDIRELEPNTGTNLGRLLAVGALALLLIAGYARRRRRPLPAEPSAAPLTAPAPPPSPYQKALRRLANIEEEHWPTRGDVARHYEQVVDVLRGYLEAAEDVPARERTTEEVLWALPPYLSAHGLRARLRELLEQADLVKFAQLVPTTEAARIFLDQCRALLRDWHEAVPQSQVADAVR